MPVFWKIFNLFFFSQCAMSSAFNFCLLHTGVKILKQFFSRMHRGEHSYEKNPRRSRLWRRYRQEFETALSPDDGCLLLVALKFVSRLATCSCGGETAGRAALEERQEVTQADTWTTPPPPVPPPRHRPGLRPTRGTVNVRPALVSCQGPCWAMALDLRLDHMRDHLSPLRRTVPSPCPARRNAAPPDEARSGRGGCTSGSSESRTRRIAISDEIMPLQM